MHADGDAADAIRLRGLIVVLWRAGLRISEALALTEIVRAVHERPAPMIPATDGE